MLNIDRCDKLASLTFRINCGVGLLDVIYDCMRCSPYETDAFVPAMYAAYEYFESIAQTADAFKAAEFAELESASRAAGEAPR